MTLSRADQENLAKFYPKSDGKPISDHNLQYEWIVTIKEGLEIFFADQPNVYVAGDCLWYPVEGNNKIRAAPDVLVAFGRPKGYRGSYLQWVEDDIPPQVVFEILSPGNRRQEMRDKLKFYDQYGVQEYYIYDPFRLRLEGWIRPEPGLPLTQIVRMNGWVSPRLGIKFEQEPGPQGPNQLKIYKPNGEVFLTPVQIDRARQRAEQRAELEKFRADNEKRRAELESQRAIAESQRADTQRLRAEAESQRAETESQRAEAEKQRAETESQRAVVEIQRAEAQSQRAEAEKQRADQLEAQLKALLEAQNQPEKTSSRKRKKKTEGKTE